MLSRTKQAPIFDLRNRGASAYFGIIAAAAAGSAILFYKRPLWVIDRLVHARLKLAGFTSHFVTVGPYRVRYFAGGAGRPLLLIHGLGSRSEDWTPQMLAYAKQGFRVYAIDLLGCGQTDRPDIAYTIQQQADLIHGFLNAIHLQQTDVIGWSMGGWVALSFALEHPRRIRRIVVMNGAGISFETNLTPEIFPPRTVPELKRFEALLTPYWRELPRFVDRDLLRAMERHVPVVRRTAETLLTGRELLDARLDRIKAPVLILWGEQDMLIPPSVAVRMHEAIPHSVLQMYSKCGHIGPVTCANRMIPRVVDFLRGEPAAAGGTYYY